MLASFQIAGFVVLVYFLGAMVLVGRTRRQAAELEERNRQRLPADVVDRPEWAAGQSWLTQTAPSAFD